VRVAIGAFRPLADGSFRLSFDWSRVLILIRARHGRSYCPPPAISLSIIATVIPVGYDRGWLGATAGEEMMKRMLLRREVVAVALVAWWVALANPIEAQSAAPAVAEFFQTFDFAQELDATAWTASTWKNATRAHSATNVTVKDGVLALKLSASEPGTKPVCAEIVSRRNDFFYGTYRASIKMSSVPGAVVGWFTYQSNPLNEIDVEFLTGDPRKAHFTLHHVKTGVDHATADMPFDPSAAFHEYRFDWRPGRVDYYVDGKQYATLTNQVPDRPSRILLNHWSGNIPMWGGKAPTEDAVILVDWVWFSSEYKAPPIR
jgi:beta-glucanase (GH16 family)